MRRRRQLIPESIELSVRDPATSMDAVKRVKTHLAAGTVVMIHDPLGCFPRFSLVRRGNSVVVLGEGGISLAAYADVEAAVRCGLTRWPPHLLEAFDAAVASAIRPVDARP